MDVDEIVIASGDEAVTREDVLEMFERLYKLVAGADEAFSSITPDRSALARAARTGTTKEESGAGSLNNPFSVLLRRDERKVTLETDHILEAVMALSVELPGVRSRFEQKLPNEYWRLFDPRGDTTPPKRQKMHKVVVEEEEEEEDDFDEEAAIALIDKFSQPVVRSQLFVPAFDASPQPRKNTGVPIGQESYTMITRALRQLLSSMRDRLDRFAQQPFEEAKAYDKATLIDDLSRLVKAATLVRDKVALIETLPRFEGRIAQMSADFSSDADILAAKAASPVALVGQLFGNVYNTANDRFERIDAVAAGPKGQVVVLDTKPIPLDEDDPRRERGIFQVWQDSNGALKQFLHIYAADGTQWAGEFLKMQVDVTRRGRMLDMATDPSARRMFLVDDGSYQRRGGGRYESYIVSLVDKPAQDGRVFKRGMLYGIDRVPDVRSVCYVDAVQIGAYAGPAVFVATISDDSNAPLFDDDDVPLDKLDVSHTIRIVAFPVSTRERVFEGKMKVDDIIAHAENKTIYDQYVTNLPRTNKVDEDNYFLDTKLRRVPITIGGTSTTVLSFLDVTSSSVVVFSVEKSGALVELSRFGVGQVTDGGVDVSGARSHGVVNNVPAYGARNAVLPAIVKRGSTPSSLVWMNRDRLVVADTPNGRIQVYEWDRSRPGARLLWNIYTPNADGKGEFSVPDTLAIDSFDRLLVSDEAKRPNFNRASVEGVVYQLRLTV